MPKTTTPEIEVLIEREEIKEKVEELGDDIYQDHKDYKELNLVTVLEGARTFSKDLERELFNHGFEVNNYFIKLSSYGSGTESSGHVEIEKDLEGNIEGKDVIIVEDIVDTGLTLSFLRNYLLKEKKANSVKIATFLDKYSRRKCKVPLDYAGFEVEDKFVVGYGIDFNEQYRDLDYIGFLKF